MSPLRPSFRSVNSTNDSGVSNRQVFHCNFYRFHALSIIDFMVSVSFYFRKDHDMNRMFRASFHTEMTPMLSIDYAKRCLIFDCINGGAIN